MGFVRKAAKSSLLSKLPRPAALLAASATALLIGTSAWAAGPSAEQALKLEPIQKDVDYDKPTGAEVEQCTIKAEKIGDLVGWTVRDGIGQLLRRFVDTNRDNVVDQWCYYRQGIEVYRDIDTNYNGKADNYRWINTAGTRWGLDKNEDGKIDEWKAISAEEVTAELVRALAQKDPNRFNALLLTPEELKTLGVGPEAANKLSAKVKEASTGFAGLVRQQTRFTDDTAWMHFAASQPGLVPAGTDGSTKDLEVYENVTVITETGDKNDQVPVGTLVKVDSKWRLIGLPDLEGAEMADAGYFFRASIASRPEVPAAGNAPDDKMQELLSKLEKLDQQSMTASPDAQARLNSERADILESLAKAASKEEEREQWIRQLADTVSAAAQSGGYPDGVKRLDSLFEQVEKNDSQGLAAYVKFRYLTAEYGMALTSPNADFAKIQTAWLDNLQQYVKDFPNSPDTAEALLQLAIAEEFAGQEDKAKQWYGRIVSEFPDALAAKKAKGAMTRLESVGKPIQLAGQGHSGGTVDLAKMRGRVVLVHYWATWCEPCVQDLGKIKELFAKYGKDGFMPVGICLDTNKTEADRFLASNRLPWPQIYETGSLDGRLANEMGILTLPTMLLIDKQGRVVNRAVHMGELEDELKKYLR